MEISYEKETNNDSSPPTDHTESDDSNDEDWIPPKERETKIKKKLVQDVKFVNNKRQKKRFDATEEELLGSGWQIAGEAILKNWKNDFNGEPMTLNSDKIMTELDVFEKFFDDSFFETLCENTNKYCDDMKKQKAKVGRLENWKDVTVLVMKIFFALIL